MNKILKSKGYGEYIIIKDLNSREVIIKFLKTNYICSVRRDAAKKGSVYDPYFPKIYGVGYFGEGNYTCSKNNCFGKISANRARQTWGDMLSRCYNSNDIRFENYGKVGVIVANDWHNFQNFANWFSENYIEDYELDKDLLNINNKLYSSETCIYLPAKINKMLVNHRYENELLMGVGLRKDRARDGKIYKCTGTGKYFYSEQDCHFSWLNCKIEKFQKAITQFPELKQEIVAGMLDRISILQYHLSNKLIFNGF